MNTLSKYSQLVSLIFFKLWPQDVGWISFNFDLKMWDRLKFVQIMLSMARLEP